MTTTKGTSRPTEVLTGSTDFYTIYTLIDITDSGITTPKIDARGYFQAQNLNTFMQTIGLRTQPVLSSVKKYTNTDVSDYDFGAEFNGQHTIWQLTFASETAKAWHKEDNPLFWLEKDFDKTPVHVSLEETVNLSPESITTSNNNKNTYFIFSENI